MILDSHGVPVKVETPVEVAVPAFTVTRQLRRAYLRVAAISVINQKAGREPRRTRRSMALTLAKRPAFIEEVRNATKAF